MQNLFVNVILILCGKMKILLKFLVDGLQVQIVFIFDFYKRLYLNVY